jgi:hypothetical protein
LRIIKVKTGSEKIEVRLRHASVRRAAASSLLALLVVSGLAGDADAADPVAECIGANERSLDLRKQGKLLDARRELATCAASTCPEAIQQACRDRIASVNASIPSIVFRVKDAAGQDLMDVQMWIDGQPAGAVGVVARQVDPGRHVFRFRAADRSETESAFVLREGESDRVESIVLGPGTTSGSPVQSETARSAAGSTPSAGPDGVARGSSASSLRTAGWIVGAVGVAALGASGALALVAKSKYDGAEGCSGAVCTAPTGFETRNTAREEGDAATVVALAGAAALTVGVVLWIASPTSPDAVRAAWRVGLTPGGAVAEGRF